MSPSGPTVLSCGAQSFLNGGQFVMKTILYAAVNDNLSIYLEITDEGIMSIVRFDLRFSEGGVP